MPKFLDVDFHVEATGKFQDLTTRIREELQLRQVTEGGTISQEQMPRGTLNTCKELIST